MDNEGYDYIELDCSDEKRLEVVMSYIKEATSNFEGMRDDK